METEGIVIGQVRLLVFLSYNFLSPVDIVDREDNIKQVQERLSNFLLFSMKDIFYIQQRYVFVR